MAERAHKPEVLAPAGSIESLRAALWNGADSVYFGLQDGFNARLLFQQRLKRPCTVDEQGCEVDPYKVSPRDQRWEAHHGDWDVRNCTVELYTR